MVLAASLLAAAAALLPLAAANPQNSPEFFQALADAPTRVARSKLFNDSDYIFDFNAPKKGETGVSTGLDGSSINVNAANMPALIGENLSLTLGKVGPCGLNTAHTHPRAAEFNYVINGSFTTGHFRENGAKVVLGNVTAGMGSLFPRGSVHYEANLECEPSYFLAAFGDEDPGALQIAQAFYGLPASIVGVTLGGALSEEQISTVKSMIPANIALGLDECVKRCGFNVVNGTITNPDHKVRQPRTKKAVVWHE